MPSSETGVFSGTKDPVSYTHLIDFLEYFRNMDFVEAVKYLLEFAGYIRTETMQKFQPERQTEKIEETKQRKDIPKEPFVLPSKSETSRRLYGYLIKQMCIRDSL